MKLVLVTGGRDYADRDRVAVELSAAKPDAVLHGDAKGADRLAGEWAHWNDCAEIKMPANWDAYGKGAGPRRNHQMVSVANTFRLGGWDVVVLAFPGGRGTEDCVTKARFRGLDVREVSA